MPHLNRLITPSTEMNNRELMTTIALAPILLVRCNFSCSVLWFYLPSEIHVCCVVVLCGGTDKSCNFSAVRSPIELKLGGDLGLVSQISVHVLVLRFDYFLYCEQTKERKNRQNRENRGFTKRVFSAVPSPINLKLGVDIWTSIRNSVVCLFSLYYCLFTFRKRK
jgi:hypothetical protein